MSTEIVLVIALVLCNAGTLWALERMIHMCQLNLELLRSYREEEGGA